MCFFYFLYLTLFDFRKTVDTKTKSSIVIRLAGNNNETNLKFKSQIWNESNSITTCFAKTKKKCLPVKKIKVKVNSFLNAKCPILKYGLRIIELLKLHLRHTLIYGVIVYKPRFVEDICGI